MTPGVTRSIQAFHLPGEEPLPIWYFFFLFWQGHFLVGMSTVLQLWVHIIFYYIPIYLLWSMLVGRKTGAAE
jgi:hypothetical protein